MLNLLGDKSAILNFGVISSDQTYSIRGIVMIPCTNIIMRYGFMITHPKANKYNCQAEYFRRVVYFLGYKTTEGEWPALTSQYSL